MLQPQRLCTKAGSCNRPARLQSAGDTISTDRFSTRWLAEDGGAQHGAGCAGRGGVFPDPYFGMNLRQIPGTTYPIGSIFANMPMAQDSPYHCGWWYRTEFAAPAAGHAGERQWLHFGGINYRGEIWLNGHKIADSARRLRARIALTISM